VTPATRPKDVFTAGEVAAICRVCSLTASRWIDRGLLKGYRVPGSLHRRVTRFELELFMSASGLPADWLTDWLVAHPDAVAIPPRRPPAMADRYRLDDPATAALAAVAALTPDQLADCSVEVRFAADEAPPWVEVYSPRDAATPLLSVELPAGAARVARLLTLRHLHELAGLCRGEGYAV